MDSSVVITPDDVVRAGACPGGVVAFIQRCKNIAAAVPVAVALKLAETSDEKMWIRRATELDGNGDGYGNDYGDGYGNDYGYGDGYGNGDDNGDGNGYGNGYGNDYGDGNGNGNGYGYGYGYGYGSKSGDGFAYGAA